MISCVARGERAPELYAQLGGSYADDPKVKVIIDRRKSERRNEGDGGGHRRELRDRRRPRVPGEFPPLEAGDELGRGPRRPRRGPAPAARPRPPRHLPPRRAPPPPGASAPPRGHQPS